MPFRIERNDITLIKADAIVNAANNSLLGGGGVDGAIHAAAGKGLLEECKTLGGCKTGEAKITKGYNLPAKYVIHTVGPVWSGGDSGEEALLRSCYRNSLRLAAENGCESVAFPLISAGVYGYPKDKAIEVACDEIKRFIKDNEIDVTLVIFDRGSFVIGSGKFGSLRSYIDENYVSETERRFSREGNLLHTAAVEPMPCMGAPAAKAPTEKKKKRPLKRRLFSDKTAGSLPVEPRDEERLLGQSYESAQCDFSDSKPEFVIDESFSRMLLRKIDEKGMTDSECYYRANSDRKLFSKIRCNADYRPKKETAVAFAIALELDISETEELLGKAGYRLSNSILFDVIIRYFIENKIYDIFEINEVLFSYDQKCL